jgi:hypothetical protein
VTHGWCGAWRSADPILHVGLCGAGVVLDGLAPLLERARANRTVVDRYHVRERGSRFADFDALSDARRIGRMLAPQSEELEIIETATGRVVERLRPDNALEREAEERGVLAQATAIVEDLGSKRRQ